MEAGRTHLFDFRGLDFEPLADLRDDFHHPVSMSDQTLQNAKSASGRPDPPRLRKESVPFHDTHNSWCFKVLRAFMILSSESAGPGGKRQGTIIGAQRAHHTLRGSRTYRTIASCKCEDRSVNTRSVVDLFSSTCASKWARCRMSTITATQSRSATNIDRASRTPRSLEGRTVSFCWIWLILIRTWSSRKSCAVTQR